MSDLVSLLQNRAVLNQLGRRGVVRVGVFPVRGEEQARPDLAKDGRQRPAMDQARLQTPVRKAEVLAPGVAQRGVGRGGLRLLAARDYPAGSARRWSGRECPPTNPAGPAG